MAGDGEVGLVGQERVPPGADSGEIPEGGGPEGFPTIDSAQRELREECGLIAARWAEILTMHLSNSVTDERSATFLAWDLTEQAAAPEETR